MECSKISLGDKKVDSEGDLGLSNVYDNKERDSDSILEENSKMCGDCEDDIVMNQDSEVGSTNTIEDVEQGPIDGSVDKDDCCTAQARNEESISEGKIVSRQNDGRAVVVDVNEIEGCNKSCLDLKCDPPPRTEVDSISVVESLMMFVLDTIFSRMVFARTDQPDTDGGGCPLVKNQNDEEGEEGKPLCLASLGTGEYSVETALEVHDEYL